MKGLFDQPEGCHCRGIGVLVDDTGRFIFCTCPKGVREQAQNAGGYRAYIGRPAGDVVSELHQQLKEKNLAS